MHLEPTGAEVKRSHYGEAEELNRRAIDGDGNPEWRDRLIASAQVHATLALADAVSVALSEYLDRQ
jgi:hypothetical protein